MSDRGEDGFVANVTGNLMRQYDPALDGDLEQTTNDPRDEKGRVKVGFIKATIIYRQRLYYSEFFAEVCDAHSQDLLTLQESLFKMDGEIKVEAFGSIDHCEVSECNMGNILFIDEVQVNKSDRGQNLGHGEHFYGGKEWRQENAARLASLSEEQIERLRRQDLAERTEKLRLGFSATAPLTSAKGNLKRILILAVDTTAVSCASPGASLPLKYQIKMTRSPSYTISWSTTSKMRSDVDEGGYVLTIVGDLMREHDPALDGQKNDQDSEDEDQWTKGG
ncbi:hypothetical protein HK102_009679 [Quaeritorhiza haematococci]|nr:hypothetical protein HK102_009679 [Quaeritorhiza haematococci]